MVMEFTRFPSHKICWGACAAFDCLSRLRLSFRFEGSRCSSVFMRNRANCGPREWHSEQKGCQEGREGWAALAAPLPSFPVAPQDRLFHGQSTPFLSLVLNSFWCQVWERSMKNSFNRSLVTWDWCWFLWPYQWGRGRRRGEEIYSDPWPCSMFKASLGHMRPCLRGGTGGRVFAREVSKQFCDTSSVILFQQEKPNLSLVPYARFCHLQPEAGSHWFWPYVFLLSSCFVCLVFLLSVISWTVKITHWLSKFAIEILENIATWRKW